jgi:putative Mg2+ transporter-C (MgtC) family protein
MRLRGMMPLVPTWDDIALRLLLTVVAGTLIGLNRGLRGHAAGLRTTILVGLAASVAMVQANILLSLGGKTPESFATMDLMRLPLGILTGVGFIGAGAILKRGDLVTGVTTAATLWMVTVIGLCLGGGQIMLGVVATGIALLTVWVLKWVDLRIPREQRARLAIRTDEGIAAIATLNGLIAPLGFRADFVRQSRGQQGAGMALYFDVSWKRAEIRGAPLDLVERVAGKYAIEDFEIPSHIHE